MKRLLLLAWIFGFITAPFLLYAQSRTITGTVTDEKGDPLVSVSVVEKGTSNGTSTNEKGQFSLNVKTINPVLVFSYAGRQSQEVAVGSYSN